MPKGIPLRNGKDEFKAKYWFCAVNMDFFQGFRLPASCFQLLVCLMAQP
jgi:hypothetical protein